VGEGAFVRDCRGVERMGVMHTLYMADYLGSGESKGGRGSRVNGRGR
jgi:hypothetical protein